MALSLMLNYPAIQGFLLGGGLIIAIGAQNAFILRQGLLRQHVFILCLLASLADAVLVVLGVAGIGSFIEANPDLLYYVTVGGAFWLVCYALLAARRAIWPQVMNIEGQRVDKVGRAISILFAFTILNPHVYLDTLLLIGSMSGHYTGNRRILFAAGAVLASFVWFFSLGFGARLLAPLFQKPNAWRVLDGVIAIVMSLIAWSLFERAFS